MASPYPQFFSSTPPRMKPKKNSQSEPLPKGSGFDRLVQKRADTNNLPGPINKFGDRVSGGFQTNKQSFLRNDLTGNARAGRKYRTGLTKSGREVHIYQTGERVVLPKRKAKFMRP